MKELIFYFKCRAGHYTLPIADYVKPKATRLTRHSSDQVVLIPKCRTKLFQFSYFNRIAKLWNTLPVSTRTLSSLNQFKCHVLQRYSAAFRTNYDVTNFNTWKMQWIGVTIMAISYGHTQEPYRKPETS